MERNQGHTSSANLKKIPISLAFLFPHLWGHWPPQTTAPTLSPQTRRDWEELSFVCLFLGRGRASVFGQRRVKIGNDRLMYGLARRLTYQYKQSRDERHHPPQVWGNPIPSADASHFAVGNLYLSAPPEFSPSLSSRLPCPRDAEIRVSFHKLKQLIDWLIDCFKSS